MSCCGEKAAAGACLQLKISGTPEAPALPTVVEAEEMFLLFVWKMKHRIELPFWITAGE